MQATNQESSCNPYDKDLIKHVTRISKNKILKIQTPLIKKKKAKDKDDQSMERNYHSGYLQSEEMNIFIASCPWYNAAPSFCRKV